MFNQQSRKRALKKLKVFVVTEKITGTTKAGDISKKSRKEVEELWACDANRGALRRKEGDAGTILGSENCQSISLQNLLSASQAFQGLSFNTVNRGCKAAAVILPGYCTPRSLPFMSLCPDKAHGYKVKVQSENISASHFSSQPVMMTG